MNGTKPRAARPQGPAGEQISLAAALCYLDELTDAQIAAELGVCRRTLARWKRRPDFRIAIGAAAVAGSRLMERSFWGEWTAQHAATSTLFPATRRHSPR